MTSRLQRGSMVWLLALFLVVGAGCDDDNDNDPAASPPAADGGDGGESDEGAAVTAQLNPPTSAQTVLGQVFVDDDAGLTLYTFENDRTDADGDGTGDSDCNDGCAETWPPLVAAQAAESGGALSVITRDDGETRQWALKGLPLYRFSGDAAAGDVNGEGSGGVWYVARPDPVAAADSSLGTILSAAVAPPAGAASAPGVARSERTGFSLYVFDNDALDADGDGVGDSDCNGGCAETWPPLYADLGATPTGAFSIITRDDGSRQWAFKGEPLYFFANDTAAGDVAGDRAGGVWHLARPAPVQLFDGGGDDELFYAGRGPIAEVDGNGAQAEATRDRTGFTLYRFRGDRDDSEGDGIGDSDCNGSCAVNWPPLFARGSDNAAGEFGIIDRADGSRQWTLEGDPLYFFADDMVPGDVNGAGFTDWFTVGEPFDLPPGDGDGDDGQGGSGAELSYDEATDGDLSNDAANPTPLVLELGANQVTGRVQDPADTRDYLTFTIEPGQALTGIFLIRYEDLDTGADGNRGFIHIDDGSSSVVPDGETASAFLGGTHLDRGLFPSAADNVLTRLAEAPQGGTGFTAPLGPGEYTLNVQQTGPQNTAYTLEIVVAATDVYAQATGSVW